jgi:PPM family protein phosphatase
VIWAGRLGMQGRMDGEPQSAEMTGEASDEASGSDDNTAYIAVTALSHSGAVRDQQEDSLVAGPWTLCATVTENPQTLVFSLGTPLVVAVADGLGGHPGGEVASALVVRQLALAGASLDSEDSVRETLRDCNRTVYAAAAGSPGLIAMGTTVAGIVLTAGRVLAFNVGDSRVYAASDGGLRQLSTDDRPSGQGLPSAVVTQTLGGHDEPTDIDPHLVTSPLAPDTSYLICTDGLTDPVPAGMLEAVLGRHQDGRAVFELWKAAIEAGGPDNITMALVRLGP